MQSRHDYMNSEEGEYEIQDEPALVQRGVQRSRSIGSRRGGGGGSSRAARSSGGSSVSSTATSGTRSKSHDRSRSSSVGRMKNHRQRSRASMASPSKYGRVLRRDSKDNTELDVSRRSVMTAATDDLSDDPSPLPTSTEGDNDSNHHLRQRLSEMAGMAAVPSPSNYRQRKQRLRNRLSNEDLGVVDQITMSPCDPEGSKQSKKKSISAAKMDQAPDLDKDSEFLLDGLSIHSDVKESIDRQQKREQAALEEVMSLVAKTKNKKNSAVAGVDVSQEAISRGPGDRSLRRTKSLNAGSGSSSSSRGSTSRGGSGSSTSRPIRRAVKGSSISQQQQKKERRDMVKSNLGMFVEDDH